MDDSVRVVLVGHCVPDSAMLTRAVRDAIPGAGVIRNIDEKSLWDVPAALMLVNRVLDGAYHDDSGMRVVREAVSRGVPAMLISNFPEALAEAEAAGACPGFGKKQVRSDLAAARIRAAIGHAEVRDADA